MAESGLHRDHGAVRQLVALALATVFVDDGHLARSRHRNQLVSRSGHGLDVVHPHHATMFDLDAVGRRRP